MRIGVFIKSTTFHKGYGGLETQNRVLCEGLAGRGYEVIVFSPSRELAKTEETLNKVKYIFIPADYYLFLLSMFRRNNWIKRSLEVFEKMHWEKRFDLVLSQSTAGVGIIRNKKRLDVKVITIAHGSALSEYKTYLNNMSSVKDLYWVVRNTQYFIRQYFGRQRECILHANKVVAVSLVVKSSLIDETFSIPKRIEVIYNGIDPKVYGLKPKEKSGKGIDLIYVGRVDKSKGVLSFVDILKKVETENVKLHILGDGPDLQKLRRMAKREGLEKEMLFYGRVSQDEVVKKLCESDIFLFPSLRVEGFPMTIVEAMFAGLPVVASNIGGISDAVEDEKTGFLVNPSDIYGFAAKVIKLIEDKSLRNNMGRNARSKAGKDFAVDVMLGRYEKVFKEVLT